jgi:ABC-type Fe3+ transport system permease subunit
MRNLTRFIQSHGVSLCITVVAATLCGTAAIAAVLAMIKGLSFLEAFQSVIHEGVWLSGTVAGLVGYVIHLRRQQAQSRNK